MKFTTEMHPVHYAHLHGKKLELSDLPVVELKDEEEAAPERKTVKLDDDWLREGRNG